MREIRGLEHAHRRRRVVRKRFIVLPVLGVILLLSVTAIGIENAGLLAKRAKAQNTVSQIITACQNFKTEYASLPETPENYRLIKILRGENPQKIKFLTLKQREVNANGEMIDPWGTPYRIVFGPNSGVKVISAGPDKIFGTKDDITYD